MSLSITHNGTHNSTHNGHSRPTPDWRLISVRDFFSQIPWTGQSMAGLGAPTTTPTAPPKSLDLRLSVQEFFQRFPWEGQPDIAVPMTPLAIQPDLPPAAEDDELTLDGFADLF